MLAFVSQFFLLTMQSAVARYDFCGYGSSYYELFPLSTLPDSVVLTFMCYSQVKVSALQNLVRVMSLYYQYMEEYMGPALFAVRGHYHLYMCYQ